MQVLNYQRYGNETYTSLFVGLTSFHIRTFFGHISTFNKRNDQKHGFQPLLENFKSTNWKSGPEVPNEIFCKCPKYSFQTSKKEV